MDSQTLKQQEKIVFNAFLRSPMTMKECDQMTGVMRENICRYVRHFRDRGQIAVIRKRLCAITKHRANEYTTNPDLFPKKTKQPTLFD